MENNNLTKKDNFYERHIFVCTFGKSCSKLPESERIAMRIKESIREKGLAKQVRLNKAGCLNWCDAGPVMVVYPEGVWYSNIKESDVDLIIEQHLVNGDPVQELMAKKDK